MGRPTTGRPFCRDSFLADLAARRPPRGTVPYNPRTDVANTANICLGIRILWHLLDHYTSQRVAAHRLLYTLLVSRGGKLKAASHAIIATHIGDDSYVGAREMKITVLTTLGLALLGLAAAGCTEGTTRKDVASAQQKLDQAKQDTADAVHDAKNDIADVQRDAREHMVNKPVIPDNSASVDANGNYVHNNNPNAVDAQRDIAAAQQKANEKIADAKDKERSAAADLKTTEQEFQATQERDSFIKESEMRLADYDKRIDDLNAQAANATAADKDAINRQVDSVKSARDRAKDALDEVKKADLASWKNHQDHVRTAFQELDNSAKSVR